MVINDLKNTKKWLYNRLKIFKHDINHILPAARYLILNYKKFRYVQFSK